MMFVDRVLGSRLDPALAERLHRLEHRGRLDVLTIPAEELARSALQGDQPSWRGGHGRAAARAEAVRRRGLAHRGRTGAVVRVDKEHWLRLEPRSLADAIELGYHAGNLHWRVRFQGEALLVALEAPVDHYLDRLGALVTGRRVAASVLTPD